MKNLAFGFLTLILALSAYATEADLVDSANLHGTPESHLRLGGWVELRPTYASMTGEFRTENELAVATQIAQPAAGLLAKLVFGRDVDARRCLTDRDTHVYRLQHMLGLTVLPVFTTWCR